MQSRSPLLNTLRRAFHLSLQNSKDGPPVEEVIAQQRANALPRRRFIGDMVKAGVAISGAGVFNSCKKLSDFSPSDTPSITDQSIGSAKPSQPKIVIIGAGMAGLNCAYQLKKSGYNTTIFEGSNRAGGRMFSKKDLMAPGLTTELGGEFIDTEHKDMLKLCHEFNLPLIDTMTAEELEFQRDTFVIDGKFYTEAEVIRAFQPYAARIKADIKSLPNVMTYDDHNAATLRFDLMSIKAYLDLIGMTGFIRKGIEIAYVTEYGLEADVQSSINFLYLFSPNTANGFELFGSSDERFKIVGGNQRLTNALYEEVKANVSLEHRLVKIKEGASGYTLYFNCGSGTTSVNADMIVSTLPFSMLREVELAVALPSWKLNAINTLAYGHNSKLMLGFNKRVWRKYGQSGYVFTNKAIQTGWDNSQGQQGSAGGFTVYGGGNPGLAMGDGTPESQAVKYLNQLEEMWPGCKSAHNGNVKRMHWPTHPFTKGSYACYKVGHYTTIRGAEAKPVGNFFFAGEHCSSYYQGFMNGAAETGRLAAQGILKAVRSREAIV
ncbi:FAD-dependent oxidoreductase [Segetibacter sp. 3557_3]|uniref:flavin monoamine oxidase family protein n=1 Tax=Segetibacter sp. 3557_3 TaxID=2547429 RepID=UPI0010585994|nr:FAD-dependent oxidoreductase [Segetibacter sp. 3557_3]TDH21419.1 FAD-dependent oxidoreductase [Segetibacter sp. 3557_3]